MMQEFRSVAPEQFDKSPFRLVGKDWMLIAAEKDGRCSGMWFRPVGNDEKQFWRLSEDAGRFTGLGTDDRNQAYEDSILNAFWDAKANALAMEHLLGKTTDRRQRAYLINHFLEQFKSTLYRQTMFAEFERRTAQLNREGTVLTADVLCAEYRKLNELYFGPDIVLDRQIELEWARIPHFYYNYYVFQYATGYSAAIALSRQILKEGKPAVDRYLGFLSGGCSKSPIELLKGAGVDMIPNTSRPARIASISGSCPSRKAVCPKYFCRAANFSINLPPLPELYHKNAARSNPAAAGLQKTASPAVKRFRFQGSGGALLPVQTSRALACRDFRSRKVSGRLLSSRRSAEGW